jgi:hypothetical protein
MVLLGLSKGDCVSEGFTDWKVVVLILRKEDQIPFYYLALDKSKE